MRRRAAIRGDGDLRMRSVPTEGAREAKGELGSLWTESSAVEQVLQQPQLLFGWFAQVCAATPPRTAADSTWGPVSKILAADVRLH